MVATLLRCGAKTAIDEAGGDVGMSALGRAAYELDVPMVKLLLRAGANPRARDIDGRSPLERMRFREKHGGPGWNEIEELLSEGSRS
jgi:hypothetical protein